MGASAVRTDLPPNFTVRPYRGVSVQEVPTLEPVALRARLLGRRVYRRTELLVAVCGAERAIVLVHRAPGEGILVDVADATIVASGPEVAFVADPDVDTASATALAAAAARAGRPAPVTVVQGRHEHVNLIADPRPLPVRVVEVVPPEPPKLLDMARAAIAVDEELPPIDLRTEPIDLRELIDAHPAPAHLLPCRSGGIPAAASVAFLDAGPPPRGDRTLVGCARSHEIHEAMYGAEPAAWVDTCPATHVAAAAAAAGSSSTPTLLRCCRLERGVHHDDAQVLVPWGASLDEVRAGLRLLAGLPAAPPPVEVSP